MSEKEGIAATGEDHAIALLEIKIRNLGRSSAATLVMIFALILSGAWVFVHAQQYTNNEVPTKSLDEKERIAQKETADISKRESDQSRLITGEGNEFYNAMTDLAQKTFAPSAFVFHPGMPDMTLINNFPEQAIEQIQNQIETMKSSKTIFGAISYLNKYTSIYASIDDWKKFEEAVRKNSFNIDFAPIRMALATQQADMARSVYLNGLIGEIEKRKIDDIVRGDSADQDNLTSWIRLIQINVTRFGTLLMVTFLVAILIPLYRYNRRLQGFYEARRQSLILLGTELSSVGFVGLCNIMTPQIDFVKIPQTPSEQILDIIKAVSAIPSRRSGAGSE